MRCPEDGSLIAYLDSELAPKERGAVTRHLESCESCGERIQQFEALKQFVRDEEREGVAAGEVTTFVASLPGRRGSFTIWPRRFAFATVFAAALVVGVSIGRTVSPKEQILEVQPRPGLPKEQLLSALTALQRLKLAVKHGAFDSDIRGVEGLLCGSLPEGEDASVVRAVRLIQKGEDAAAEEDFMAAASFFDDAAKVCGETIIGSYARLQHAKVLAEKLGYYDTALDQLAALSVSTDDRALSREAEFLLARCQMALGDVWGAAGTLDNLARAAAAESRFADLAMEVGDMCYGETLDLETAQHCYLIWGDMTADSDARLRKAKETRSRLALLEESADDRWEPLELYLRAEKAYPDDAQYMYARIVGSYPANTLADSAFVKWYGLEQPRQERRQRLEPRRASDLARWENVADSEAPEEIRAYARLKIADRLHAQLDGVPEVVLAYHEVVDEFPWTPTARVARDRADAVRDTIEQKQTML
jgi:hypothetical protein